jgi:hypothetical protein
MFLQEILIYFGGHLEIQVGSTNFFLGRTSRDFYQICFDFGNSERQPHIN